MKKLIAVITVIVLLIPMCVFYGSASEDSIGVAYIDGQIISRSTLMTNNLSGDGWSWDHTNQRLQLSGYDGGAIYLPWLVNYDGYNINLAAGTENVITGTAFGLALPCGRITGTGKLTINLTDTSRGNKVKHDVTGEYVDFMAGIHPYMIGGTAEYYREFKLNNGGTVTINVTVPEFNGSRGRYGIYAGPECYGSDIYIDGAGAVKINMIVETSDDDHGDAPFRGISSAGDVHIIKTANVDIRLQCKSNPYKKLAPYATGIRCRAFTISHVAKLNITCEGFEYNQTNAQSTGLYVETEFTMMKSGTLTVEAARPLFTMSGDISLEGDGIMTLTCSLTNQTPISVKNGEQLDIKLSEGYKKDDGYSTRVIYYKTLPIDNIPIGVAFACAGGSYPDDPTDAWSCIVGVKIVEVRTKMFGKIMTGTAGYGDSVGLEIKVATTGDYVFKNTCTASTPGVEWGEGFATSGMDSAHELWFTCSYTVGYNEDISIAEQPPETVYYKNGGTITAFCRGTSVYSFEYQWYERKTTHARVHWDAIEGQTERTFAVNGADESWDGKVIVCRIGNQFGYNQTKSVTLVMNDSGEAPPSALRGDLNDDGKVTSEDAIYLLYHVFFSSDYPVSQDCDFNNDGNVTSEDAIYLLYHVFFAYDYPLL